MKYKVTEGKFLFERQDISKENISHIHRNSGLESYSNENLLHKLPRRKNQEKYQVKSDVWDGQQEVTSK